MAITRTPIVDDDGTGTTGTVVDNAWKQQLYDQIDAADAAVAAAAPTFPAARTETTTGNITSLVLPTGTGTLFVQMNNATLATIQGITAGLSAQRLIIASIGAGQVDLSHQDAAATAAKRLVNFATVGKTSLAPGVGVAELVYDAANARWKLVTHDQGAWIAFTPTLSGTTQTYSTQSGVYYLRGRVVTVNGYILLSAKGNAVGTITNLPFAAAAAPSYNAASIGQVNSLATTWVSIGGYIAASGSVLTLVGRTTASTGVATIGNADLGNSTDIMFAATYPVA